MASPLVAIVGRPNVGKSTLFNRILGRRTAVVDAQAGVTRDRAYQEAIWQGKRFTLIDTGGIELSESQVIANQVTLQAERAIAEADLILFLVDGKAGLHNDDKEVAAILRRSGKPVVLVINKIDNFQKPIPLAEFYPLGLGEPFPVSASEGLNTGDLLELITSKLPFTPEEEVKPATRIAVIGRPNVGKSSLVNYVLGEERVIVSSEPGTTRDAVDTHFFRQNKEYVLTDTAGIRRRTKIKEPIEKYSVQRAARALNNSEIALLVLEATAGVAKQDQIIAGLAEDAGKATIIVVNKWDLVDESILNREDYLDLVYDALGFVAYAPVIFVSAVTGLNIGVILDTVDEVITEYQRRIPTSELNQLMHDAFLVSPPPTYKGKKPKLLYCTQVSVSPPTFLLFVNAPEIIAQSYRRYLENQLRRTYGFSGSPVRIVFKGRRS